MISVRTLGTSEKNCRANIPATAPNPPNVIPLLRETCQPIFSPIVALWVAVALCGCDSVGMVGGYTILQPVQR